jgi:hypothetical protein
MGTRVNQRPSRLMWLIRILSFVITFTTYNPFLLSSQCLSSVNPVGGSDNLLVLEKNALRVISFYKSGQGKQYYEGSQHSDFDLISRAYYNYLSAVVGYGITGNLTLEIESGYFFNKTQDYDVGQGYRLTGKGLSNFVALARHGVYSDHTHRFYTTAGWGVKVPSSRNLQLADYVKLPVEVQPTLGAYGGVFTASVVKENSFTGMRYFLTTRMEAHLSNKEDYRPGTGIYTSVYVSKHLMYPWLKGDWTAIIQLKNEIRGYDKMENIRKVSSGSVLFFAVPQLNYSWREKWNVSALTDLPLYQYFNGTQLGAGTGFSLIVSRTFAM